MAERKSKFEELREKNKTMIGNEVVSPRTLKNNQTIDDENVF